MLVSIPAGFSDALRPELEQREAQPVPVSIPAGFSDALRPTGSFRSDPHSSFQSLLGFLMRCDANYLGTLPVSGDVSIPAGFSDALRLVGGYIAYRMSVSIPAGFSDALRP